MASVIAVQIAADEQYNKIFIAYQLVGEPLSLCTKEVLIAPLTNRCKVRAVQCSTEVHTAVGLSPILN